MASAPEFDIVIYGASGFTGRLVAEYLAHHQTGSAPPRWAMAGRSTDKLAEVRQEIGALESIALIAADAGDPASLEALARRARVVLTTVGPYQLYGSALVAACAAQGTDYVDLCGEPAWMRQMIDAHEAAAKRSGARIVFSCGFDSIPFDLGVYAVQQLVKARFGHPAPHVKGRVRAMKGGFSGGTAASLKATLAAAAADSSIFQLLVDPFALAPGFEGPPQPRGTRPEYDTAIESWTAPFIMAPINTKNVHRSNVLMGHGYGTDFVYDEMLVTGPGEAGEAAARAVAGDKSMTGEGGPKPGEGPSREERESGYYDVLFIAEMPDGQTLRLSVKGDRDPGYGSTSKMIAESALCLLRDVPHGPGGIWTPASAMGDKLIERLEAHAGLSFRAE